MTKQALVSKQVTTGNIMAASVVTTRNDIEAGKTYSTCFLDTRTNFSIYVCNYELGNKISIFTRGEDQVETQEFW